MNEGILKSLKKLAKQLDGAFYVDFVEELGLIQAWFGGNNVNIYDLTGRDVYCYTMDPGTTEDPQTARAHIREQRDRLGDD